MAHAGHRYSTSDHKILAAAKIYLAENKALDELCARYDTLPDSLAGAVLDRMQEAKHQALQQRPTSMVGVMALARMARADGFFEADPLTTAIVRGLLRVYRLPQQPRLPRQARVADRMPEPESWVRTPEPVGLA
jgi:hypothetical protein